jgi:hypothetical protein
MPCGRGELGGHVGLPNRRSGVGARRPLSMGARLTGRPLRFGRSCRGSNPLPPAFALIAQSAGGGAFKTRTVRVRIPLGALHAVVARTTGAGVRDRDPAAVSFPDRLTGRTRRSGRRRRGSSPCPGAAPSWPKRKRRQVEGLVMCAFKSRRGHYADEAQLAVQPPCKRSGASSNLAVGSHTRVAQLAGGGWFRTSRVRVRIALRVRMDS